MPDPTPSALALRLVGALPTELDSYTTNELAALLDRAGIQAEADADTARLNAASAVLERLLAERDALRDALRQQLDAEVTRSYQLISERDALQHRLDAVIEYAKGHDELLPPETVLRLARGEK